MFQSRNVPVLLNCGMWDSKIMGPPPKAIPLAPPVVLCRFDHTSCVLATMDSYCMNVQ